VVQAFVCFFYGFFLGGWGGGLGRKFPINPRLFFLVWGAGGGRIFNEWEKLCCVVRSS